MPSTILESQCSPSFDSLHFSQPHLSNLMATDVSSAPTLPRSKRARAPISTAALEKQIEQNGLESNARVAQFSATLVAEKTSAAPIIITPAVETPVVVAPPVVALPVPPPPPPAVAAGPSAEEMLAAVSSVIDVAPATEEADSAEKNDESEAAADTTDADPPSKRARADQTEAEKETEKLVETVEQIKEREAKAAEEKREKRNKAQRERKERKRKEQEAEKAKKQAADTEIENSLKVLAKHGGKPTPQTRRITRRSSCRCTGFRVVILSDPLDSSLLCVACSHEICSF